MGSWLGHVATGLVTIVSVGVLNLFTVFSDVKVLTERTNTNRQWVETLTKRIEDTQRAQQEHSQNSHLHNGALRKSLDELRAAGEARVRSLEERLDRMEKRSRSERFRDDFFYRWMENEDNVGGQFPDWPAAR